MRRCAASPSRRRTVSFHTETEMPLGKYDEPIQFGRRSRSVLSSPKPTLEQDGERFERLIEYEANSGCWLWAGRNGGGLYGMFSVGHRCSVRAHRWSWANRNGPIQSGLNVLHHCDTPMCVNPDHLYVGTPLDNAADRVRRGRERHRVGEEHWAAKLKEDDVRLIRLVIASKESTKAKLSRKYGVSERTIRSIVSRRIWKSVA